MYYPFGNMDQHDVADLCAYERYGRDHRGSSRPLSPAEPCHCVINFVIPAHFINTTWPSNVYNEVTESREARS